MRMLTKRGMGLKEIIGKTLPDAEIIEVYPGASYDILGAGRKDKNGILRLFRKCKLSPKRGARSSGFSQDELDAVCCALTGSLYKKGRARAIGDNGEGVMVIPILPKVKNVRQVRKAGV